MIERVPAWVSREAVVYPPHFDVVRLAGITAERAWVGRGVRVFMWPCGSAVVVRVASAADAKLQSECPARLIGTWSQGATLKCVLADLRWSRGNA